jgi:esterase/lipase
MPNITNRIKLINKFIPKFNINGEIIMGDLLKEALAEAKLVKKVSIEAAREQLNEALTPKIESMLSKKIKEELEDDEFENPEELEETEDPGDVTDKIDKTDQDVTPELSETEDPGDVTDKIDKTDQDVTPELTEEDEMGEEIPSEEQPDEDDLEIESLLRELEDEEEVVEQDDEEITAEIPAEVPAEDEEIPVEAIEDDEKVEEEDLPGLVDVPGPVDDDEEEINVEALLSQIDEEEYPGEGESEDKDKEQQNVVKQLESKNAALRKRLAEYVKAVQTLKRELNEVNLLNTKLYYTTKMLKKFNISERTKRGIIETFDRANSVREIKLIYTTLHESLKNGTGSPIVKKPIKSVKDIKESVRSSSKAVITDQYVIKEAILSEGDDLKNRWAKLSGIKK